MEEPRPILSANDMDDAPPAPSDSPQAAQSGALAALESTAEAPGAPAAQQPAAPRPAGSHHTQKDEHWAKPVDKIETDEVPPGATAVNLEGREVVNPTHGFGQLWRRTYRVRLTGLQSTSAEVMAYWKAHFPEFQPPENRFMPTSDGVQPGELVFIDTHLVNAPGISTLTPMASGVMVIYADEESFTVMTPQGFPVSGWNTFSVYEEDGVLVAQVQGLERATDPLYEFGYRFLGGEKKQDATWRHVLRSLAEHYGIHAEVEHSKVCVDPALQWRNAGNIWNNAAVRTTLYKVTTPFRWLGDRLRRG